MNLDPRFFHAPAPERAALELADLPTRPIPLAADDAGARPGRRRCARPAATLRAALHELPELHHAAPHLGEALLQAGLIDPRHAGTRARAAGTPAHRALGRIPRRHRRALRAAPPAHGLAEWQGVRVIIRTSSSLMPACSPPCPRALAERDGVLPLLMDGDALVVLVADPWDHALLDQLLFASAAARIRPLMALPGGLMPAVHHQPGLCRHADRHGRHGRATACRSWCCAMRPMPRCRSRPRWPPSRTTRWCA